MLKPCNIELESNLKFSRGLSIEIRGPSISEIIRNL